jgi:hypothetical protein
MVYNHYSPALQEPVDITDFAVELCDASEVREFFASLPEPEPENVTAARWEIIGTYESGAIGAVEAFKALEAFGCLKDPDEAMRALCAGYRANLKLGELPSPSPLAGEGSSPLWERGRERAPIPTVSNAAPFEPHTGRAA